MSTTEQQTAGVKNDDSVKHTMCGMKARTTSEIVANTRLIAAAPELLAGMREVMALLESGELVRDISHDGNADWAMRMLKFTLALNRWQLAIAKATS